MGTLIKWNHKKFEKTRVFQLIMYQSNDYVHFSVVVMDPVLSFTIDQEIKQCRLCGFKMRGNNLLLATADRTISVSMIM